MNYSENVSLIILEITFSKLKHFIGIGLINSVQWCVIMLCYGNKPATIPKFRVVIMWIID